MYRNSKWTDLKVQNIKGSHLYKFLRINIIIALSAVCLFAVAFRQDSTFFYSLTSELNYFWLIITDFFSYISAVTLTLLLNVYLFALASYYKVLNRFTGAANSKVYKSDNLKIVNSSTKRFATRENNFNFQTRTKNLPEKEAFALKILFTAKRNLDYFITPSANTTILASKSTNGVLETILKQESFNTSENRSIHNIESAFMLSDIKKNFSKKQLSELSVKKLATDPFIFSTVEDSIESTLATANANRWLIKMLPFSENLNINNLYFSKAKSNISNSLVNSKISNSNLWVSSSSLDGILSSTSSQQLYKYSSQVNDFEVSRLWNQKKSYYTLISRLSETKPIENYTSDTYSNFNINNDNSYILSLVGSDYSNFKSSMNLSYLNTLNSNTSTLADVYNLHLSNSSLSSWNSMDKIYLISLFTTDSVENSVNFTYDFTNYNNLYTTVLNN